MFFLDELSPTKLRASFPFDEFQIELLECKQSQICISQMDNADEVHMKSEHAVQSVFGIFRVSYR